MLTRRIIPCLDVRDGRVVKGTRFVDLVDAGDPVAVAARYNDEGADELVYLDITATHEGRGILLDVVRRTAARVFLPLTVGGGVRTLDDLRALLGAGADKVSINSAAVADPAFVTAAARRFGRQCITVAIDARQCAGGAGIGTGSGAATDAGTVPSAGAHEPRWEVVVHGGRRPTGRDAIAWAVEAAARGAGEILLTSMDRDGTGDGYDLALTRAVSRAVGVPVIASGGAGTPAHFVAAFREGEADAALAAGIFHRREVSIADVKAALARAELPVRPPACP